LKVEGAKEKMRWKSVLAVLLLLAILGVFFISDLGRPFLGSWGEGLGGLTGFVFKSKPSGEGFELVITTQPETFYLQKYKVSGTTVYVDGIYSFLRVGDQVFESKSGKSIVLNVKSFDGDIEFTTGGSIILAGSSPYVELGDLISSNERGTKVEIEIIPSTAIISDFGQSSLRFASISGRLDRYVGEAYDSITLTGGKLNIDNFFGVLKFEDSKATLTGTATSAKGDNFSFV